MRSKLIETASNPGATNATIIEELYAISMFLKRNQAMLLRWTKFSLRAGCCESLRQVLRGLGGLDHVIHKSPASGHIRISKSIAIAIDQFLATPDLVFRGINLMPEDDFRCAFSPHDCDFSRR